MTATGPAATSSTAVDPGSGTPTVSKTLSWARRAVWHDEGATLIEYTLLIALIAIIVLVAVQALGNNTNTLLTNAASTLAS